MKIQQCLLILRNYSIFNKYLPRFNKKINHQFEPQNPPLLIVYTHERADEKYWSGDFVIEITKENIVLYDADYSVQATTWKPFSAVGASRIVFLPKKPDEIISYKLSCLCPVKNSPHIEVSSNSGTLACNSRKKIRIHAGDCIVRNGTLKTIFGNDYFVKIRLKKCADKRKCSFSNFTLTKENVTLKFASSEGTARGQMTKSLQTSFPPPYALPKTLENYMKGIGYTDVIAGNECSKLEEKSFMKLLILMLIPLIVQTTPPNCLKYESDGIKIIWESQSQRTALIHQYVEMFKKKVLSNQTFEKLQ